MGQAARCWGLVGNSMFVMLEIMLLRMFGLGRRTAGSVLVSGIGASQKRVRVFRDMFGGHRYCECGPVRGSRYARVNRSRLVRPVKYNVMPQAHETLTGWAIVF